MMSSQPGLAVLGSGSGGNCSFLRRPDGTALLIDAGLSPRMTRDRAQRLGLALSSVTDILLTHADGDHFHRGWVRVLERRSDIDVHIHTNHLRAIEATGLHPRRVRILMTGCDGAVRSEVGTTRVTGTLLPHDRAGTIAYRIEVGETAIGFATDIGQATDELHELMDGVSLLCLESNYDPTMQSESRRPEMLKARITGGRGHLSNEQALDAARRIDRRSRLRHLVLLHLSRQCNCPTRVRSLYAEAAPELVDRLVITHQHEPTAWLACTPSAVAH